MSKRIAICGILILAAATASAQSCTPLYEILGNGGKAWLGINANGFVAGEGQTFTVDCEAPLRTISFELVLDGQTWNDAPPLGVGDVLTASVRMPSIGLTLGTAAHLIDFDAGTRWITFDFTSQGISLPVGEYLVTCAPTGSGQGRLSYSQGDDVYAGGVRYLSQGGSSGPWVPIDPSSGDLALRVEMDAATPAETMSWGAVKALYR